jgi:hypothetical protein
VLSLDAAQPPSAQTSAIRLRLLDVTGLPGFDDADLDEFLRHLFVADPNPPHEISRQAAPGTLVDLSRFDLNGDGFTTAGARRERFDLDRVGSTQYGATLYSTVSQNIEGAEVRFDETALTDLEILCYYAYSPLYTGDPDVRKELLAGRCGLAVQPATASLSPGQTQQFTALLPTSNPVVWTATCGAVDEHGLYTAGNGGPCTVRATDANDSSVSGTATVSILGTFVAEDGYDATIRGLDHFNGTEIFPREDAGASNSHRPDPILGPIDLSHAGPYQHLNFAPVNYTITAHGDGPIERPIAGTGTFNVSSGCSAQGNTTTDTDGNETIPAMPELRSDSSGSTNVTVPPGGLSFSVTGSMTRSESRGTGGQMDLSGLVTIRYSDAGGPLQTVRFELLESTGASVPFAFSQRLTAPASLAIDWRVTAQCFVTGTSSGIDAARAGAVTLSYSLSN